MLKIVHQVVAFPFAGGLIDVADFFVGCDVSDFDISPENDYIAVKCKVHGKMRKDIRYDVLFRWNGSPSEMKCTCSYGGYVSL